jgi:hypothetical protein
MSSTFEEKEKSPLTIALKKQDVKEVMALLNSGVAVNVAFLGEYDEQCWY